MIHGGWSYVEAAYAASLIGLAALVASVVLRLLHWSRAARQLDKPGAAS